MSEQGTTRRGIVGAIATAIAGLPFAGGLLVALRSAAAVDKVVRPKRIPLARLDEVPATGILARPITYEMRRGAAMESVAEHVFLSRDPKSGTVIALSSRCTHLGCPVTFDPKDHAAPLHCPCHDARFAADGTVLKGPPKRPLRRLPIVLPDDPDGTIELVLS